MKNEGPFILEWLAYHRSIGVDDFLIYTNECSDGTAEILDRLQQMGVLQHRDNTDWKGNSPQQHALNLALDEDTRYMGPLYGQKAPPPPRKLTTQPTPSLA